MTTEETPEEPTSDEDLIAEVTAAAVSAMTDPPSEDAPPPNPLDALGLGPMWRPSPTSWRWATIDMTDGSPPLHVLRIFNAGGALGIAMFREQLEVFVAEATAQLSGGMVPEAPELKRPGLYVPGQGVRPAPNRQQRRQR